MGCGYSSQPTPSSARAMTADFIGTLPGWITAASTTTGVVALVVGYWRRGISLKGLQNADEADIRDHYAEELERVIKRQRECELREEALRSRVGELENNVRGLIGIIRQASTDKVIALGPEVSEQIRDMAERVGGRAAK